MFRDKPLQILPAVPDSGVLPVPELYAFRVLFSSGLIAASEEVISEVILFVSLILIPGERLARRG
jgi:hypothetical protein